MFKFLKDKLKSFVSNFSKKAEEIKADETLESETKLEKPIEIKEDEKTALKEIKKPIEQKSFEIKIEKKETLEEKPRKSIQEKITIGQKLIDEKTITKKPVKDEELNIEKEITPEPEKKGFFAKLTEKITTTKISGEQFEKLFSDLELILMENNVAVEVIDKIRNDLSQSLVDKPIKRLRIEDTIKEALKVSIGDLFSVEEIKLIEKIKEKAEKPFVIAFFGINGSGKTTSIAKLANILKENNISCVLAASDTFRAASIEQLQQHADKLNVKLVKHTYGSDPAAVAFDAIKHAKAKNIDVVLIDTAGRLHSNANLMQEMKKIIRVAKPDLKIFVGEAITGNDCVEQAKSFNDTVGIDGIILAKADIDEKGGAAISISYITKKPIMYLGIGQKYNDLKEFEPKIVVEGLGL